MRTMLTLLVSAAALLLSLLSVIQPAAADTLWEPFYFSDDCMEVVDPAADFAVVGHANITQQDTFYLEEKP